MNQEQIPPEDAKFLTEKLMPFFGLPRVRMEFSPSPAKYPDIWIKLSDGVPEITYTKEWLRQSPAERQKRLTHEILHTTGLQHNGTIGYTSKPETDTLSRKVYQMVLAHSTPNPPKVLRLSKNLTMRRRQ